MPFPRRRLVTAALCWWAALAIPSVAAAQVPESITVVALGNVRELFIAPAGETDWGPNVIRGPVHDSHRSASVPQGKGCLFNVRAVLADGSIEEAWNLDWCRDDAIIYASCAGQGWCTLQRPAGPAPGAFRDVYVLNGLDDFPREFYIVPAEATSWGQSYPLNRDWTPTSFTLLGGHCVYHIKIVHKSGRVSYFPNHNACTSEIFSIKGAGVSGDPLARGAAAPGRSRSAAEDKQIADCTSGRTPQIVLEQCRLAFINMAYTRDERPKLHLGRARALRAIGENDEALANLAQAIEHGGTDSEIYNQRGLIYSAKQDYGAAVREYGAALERRPDSAALLRNRANAWMWLGNYDQAETDAARAISIAPQDAAGYNRRGLVRRQRGAYGGAIEDFSRAMSLDGKNASYVSNRGIAHLLAGRDGPALDDLNRAIALDGNAAYSRFARGVLFGRQGRTSESEADLAAARAANTNVDEEMKRRGVVMTLAAAAPGEGGPDRARALIGQAHDAFDRGDFPLAGRLANEAIGAMGDDIFARVVADAHNLLGVMQLNRGEFGLAEMMFTAATVSDGSQPTYFVNLAYAKIRGGRGSEAREELDTAIRLDPRNPDALFLRAVVKLTAGDRAGGDADLQAARRLRADIDAAMAKLGITLPRAGG